MRRTYGFRPGYTLVEILVVVGIIGVLVSLTASAVMSVRAAAARTACLNSLRQIGLAAQNYHARHGQLPPGSSSYQTPTYNLTWLGHMLDDLDQGPLAATVAPAFARFPNAGDTDHPGFMTNLPVALCPLQAPRESTPREYPAAGTYIGVLGTDHRNWNGVLYIDSRTRLGEVTDGTSNTLLAGERPTYYHPDRFSLQSIGTSWYASQENMGGGSPGCGLGARETNGSPFHTFCGPGPFHFRRGDPREPCDGFHFWSLHGGGAHFAFCDGSARFLTFAADAVLPELATRAGGETVTLPD